MKLPETTNYDNKRAVVVELMNDGIHSCETEAQEHEFLTSLLAKYSEMADVDTFNKEKTVTAVPFYDTTNLFYLLNYCLARTIQHNPYVAYSNNGYDRMHPQCEDLAVINLDGEPTLYIHYVHGDCGCTAFYLEDLL